MNLIEAAELRHSVRQYTGEPISAEDRTALEACIARCNERGGLHMSLVCDEPEAFGSGLAHYGSFRGASNYIVIAGAPAADLDERAGYYGELVALEAQRLGLNTCWVALTFKKRLVRKLLAPGEELALVIAIGHGATQGAAHHDKARESFCTCAGEEPAWFAAGINCAMLAPTAINQQKFHFELVDAGGGASAAADAAGEVAGTADATNGAGSGGHGGSLGVAAGAGDLPVVRASTAAGPYAKVDLGIAKLHFELGAGANVETGENDVFAWAGGTL